MAGAGRPLSLYADFTDPKKGRWAGACVVRRLINMRSSKSKINSRNNSKPAWAMSPQEAHYYDGHGRGRVDGTPINRAARRWAKKFGHREEE
jgi:hypothetical protein